MQRAISQCLSQISYQSTKLHRLHWCPKWYSLVLLLLLVSCGSQTAIETVVSSEPIRSDDAAQPAVSGDSAAPPEKHKTDSAIGSRPIDRSAIGAATSEPVEASEKSEHNLIALDTASPTAGSSVSTTARTVAQKDCQLLTTQLELNQCAQHNAQAAEASLATTYQLLMSSLPEPGNAALDMAQADWRTFRDLDCRFASDKYKGGSIAPLIYSDCIRERTVSRNVELSEPPVPSISYAEADGILNADYQVLMTMLSEERQLQYADVQLAWLDYRDSQCAFEATYGSATTAENQCLARLSDERNQQIQEVIEAARNS